MKTQSITAHRLLGTLQCTHHHLVAIPVMLRELMVVMTALYMWLSSPRNGMMGCNGVIAQDGTPWVDAPTRQMVEQYTAGAPWERDPHTLATLKHHV